VKLHRNLYCQTSQPIFAFLTEGQAGQIREGNQGREQEPGNGQVLTGVGPVREKANTGICSLVPAL